MPQIMKKKEENKPHLVPKKSFSLLEFNSLIANLIHPESSILNVKEKRKLKSWWFTKGKKHSKEIAEFFSDLTLDYNDVKQVMIDFVKDEEYAKKLVYIGEKQNLVLGLIAFYIDPKTKTTSLEEKRELKRLWFKIKELGKKDMFLDYLSGKNIFFSGANDFINYMQSFLDLKKAGEIKVKYSEKYSEKSKELFNLLEKKNHYPYLYSNYHDLFYFNHIRRRDAWDCRFYKKYGYIIKKELSSFESSAFILWCRYLVMSGRFNERTITVNFSRYIERFRKLSSKAKLKLYHFLSKIDPYVKKKLGNKYIDFTFGMYVFFLMTSADPESLSKRVISDLPNIEKLSNYLAKKFKNEHMFYLVFTTYLFSRYFDIDPRFALSICWAETGLGTIIRNDDGGVGLYQLTRNSPVEDYLDRNNLKHIPGLKNWLISMHAVSNSDTLNILAGIITIVDKQFVANKDHRKYPWYIARSYNGNKKWWRGIKICDAYANRAVRFYNNLKKLGIIV